MKYQSQNADTLADVLFTQRDMEKFTGSESSALDKLSEACCKIGKEITNATSMYTTRARAINATSMYTIIARAIADSERMFGNNKSINIADLVCRIEACTRPADINEYRASPYVINWSEE